MAKNAATFTSEAKILGAKLKPSQGYNSEGNKLEITFELEMPRPVQVQSFAQWRKNTSYGEGPAYQLKDRERDVAAAEKAGTLPTATKARGKKGAAAAEGDAPDAATVKKQIAEMRTQLDADFAAAYATYDSKARRRNARAAAAANHAGLFMALGGQKVRVAISPHQAGLPGMLALDMPAEEPDDLDDDEEDYSGDDDIDEEAE